MNSLVKLSSSGIKACGFSASKASWLYKGYKLIGCDDWYLVFKPNGERWRTFDSLNIAKAVIDLKA